ncbi:MAG: hypothetical protein J6P16_04860 [Eubacterium sp.]|nr:hypothetical protein [Eubacterium sp.]
MAKAEEKNENNEENIEATADAGDGAGSKIVTMIIVLVIVIIWLAIFGILIKLDVGGFGSGVLYPVLKDVPVINNILPEPDEKTAESGYYDNLADANARIKELEAQLASSNSADTANTDEIEELKKENARLKKFEEAQSSFARQRSEFYEEVVYNDKAPDTEEYKKFYESIDPDNAAKIYEKVAKKYQYSQEIKDQADIYGRMEPAKAAEVLSEMAGDLDLVAQILDSMQAGKVATILNQMDKDVAAQITTKMTANKK